MAFFQRTSGGLVPSPFCIGPWHPKLQHGGPPSALLVGAAERFGEDASSFVVVRITVELLRPISLDPLTVDVAPLRLGRKAQWLRSEIHGGGRRLARATVVRVARSELSLPPKRTIPEPAPPGPDELPEFVFPFFQTDQGYHRAVEVRIVEGVWGEGPFTAWMRPRFPLVESERTSPLERLMILADATNGLAPALPVDSFTFINPDLTVHLSRSPVGEWLALAARSIADPVGTGLVQSRLFDQGGEIGRALQSLVIRPR